MLKRIIDTLKEYIFFQIGILKKRNTYADTFRKNNMYMIRYRNKTLYHSYTKSITYTSN